MGLLLMDEVWLGGRYCRTLGTAAAALLNGGNNEAN